MKLKIYILCTCFLTAFISAEERKTSLNSANNDQELRPINLDLLYPTKQITSKDFISTSGPERVIMDSRVIYDKDNILFNIEGVKKQGSYATFINFRLDFDDQINSRAQKNIEQISPINEISLKQSELISKSIETNNILKLAVNQNNGQSFITNGRLIVHFKEVSNLDEFAEEYDLKQVYDFTLIKVYELNDLDRINETITLLENDPRIKTITLDKVAESINLR
jgi:hypothetical protein